MLELFNLFIKVAEQGSFTAVAKKMGISQSAVSNQIKVLEEKLETKLFERKNALKLTSDGEIAYSYIKQILDLYARMIDEMNNQNEISGIVQIGASNVPGEYILPLKLSAFQKFFPRIRFKVIIGSSLEIKEKIIFDELDFGIVGSKFDDELLRSEFWLKDELKLILSENHQLNLKEVITVGDLFNHSMILREKGSGQRKALEKALALSGYDLNSFNIGFEVGSTQAVINTVRSGKGYSFVSQNALGDKMSGLQIRDVQDLKIKRNFYIIYKKNKLFSKAADVCYEYLKQSRMLAGGR